MEFMVSRQKKVTLQVPRALKQGTPPAATAKEDCAEKAKEWLAVCAAGAPVQEGLRDDGGCPAGFRMH